MFPSDKYCDVKCIFIIIYFIVLYNTKWHVLWQNAYLLLFFFFIIRSDTCCDKMHIYCYHLYIIHAINKTWNESLTINLVFGLFRIEELVCLESRCLRYISFWRFLLKKFSTQKMVISNWREKWYSCIRDGSIRLFPLNSHKLWIIIIVWEI